MEVGQVPFAQPDRRGWIVLLDVHVERVEQHAEGGRGDPIHNLQHLLCRVHEAGLETVQGLEGERHAPLGGVVGDGPQVLHQAPNRGRPFGRVHRPRLSNRRIDRPRQGAGAGAGGHVYGRANVLLRRLDHLAVLADEVAFRRHDRGGRRLETELV